MSEQSSKLSFHAESMTTGAPFRAIIKFAVPLILGYILEHKNWVSPKTQLQAYTLKRIIS